MFKVGDKVKIASDNDNENYDKFRGKTLIVTHVAKNTDEHRGYDDSMEGMALYDFRGVPFSLYEYELESKYAKGSTIKGGKFNLEEFNDWWFDGGEETADEEYGELVTKALLKKQPSYPNEANAYSEALWELAKKDNAHKKYAKGSTVKGGGAISRYRLVPYKERVKGYIESVGEKQVVVESTYEGASQKAVELLYSERDFVTVDIVKLGKSVLSSKKIAEVNSQGIVKYAKGSTVKGNKWSEVKSDFTDEDGTVFIDAYLTEDDNEEGKVIAKVKPNGSVEYLDNSAKSDAYAQEIIKEVVADMKGTKYAKGSNVKGGGIELEDKVKIVANLEDHEGYKGQVVEVIGYDDMGYLTVESSDGTQWYVGEEEVKLVKKGSGKHEAEIRKQSAKAKKDIEAMRSAIGGGVNYFKFVSSKTNEYRKEGYSLVDAIDTAFRDLGLETGGKFEKKEFDDLLKSNANLKKAWNQYKQNSEIYLENGYYVNPYQGQYANGGYVEGGTDDLSTKEKGTMYVWIDNFLEKYSGDDNRSQSLDMYKEFAKKFNKSKEQTHDIIDSGWARSRGYYEKAQAIKKSANKYGNGGGVAVSSESGLAVGTNADLMMNQNNLQYADGGAVGEEEIEFYGFDNEKLNDDYYVENTQDGKSRVYFITKYWILDAEGKNTWNADAFVGYEDFDSVENIEHIKSEILNESLRTQAYNRAFGHKTKLTHIDIISKDYYNDFLEEAEEERKEKAERQRRGNDDYANGGNMSSGFNYSIGGL
jgi:hypothetical protein